MRWWLAALTVSVLAFTPPGAADHVRVETEDYFGFSTTGGTNVRTMCGNEINVGDACFDVLPHETSADVTVTNAFGQPVAALARLYDADFVFVGWSGEFCGFMDNLGVTGAAFLVVQPMDPVNANQACSGQGTGSAYVGTATVGFH